MKNLYTFKGVGIKKDGKVIVDAIYDDIKPAIVDGKESDTIFKTLIDDQVGLIKLVDDKKSNYKEIKPIYEDVGEFIDSIAIVSIGSPRHRTMYTLMDTDLEEFPYGCMYDKITRLGNGYFDIIQNGYHGVINSEGLEIIPCTFKSITFDPDTKKFELEACE